MERKLLCLSQKLCRLKNQLKNNESIEENGYYIQLVKMLNGMNIKKMLSSFYRPKLVLFFLIQSQQFEEIR